MNYCPLTTDCVTNSNIYCLINSVDFHPEESKFCATFSGRNLIIIYSIDKAGRVQVVQKITGSSALLNNPQHAIFSRNGNKIIAVNWSGETFTIYSRLPDESYSSKPISIVSFPNQLFGYKPHGLAINSTGNFIAAAFGASSKYPKAIAIFAFDEVDNNLHLSGLLDGSFLPGIPKGICFTPDDSHLMVTFSNVNFIRLYVVNVSTGNIESARGQTLQGMNTGLDRPEDIKLSHLKDQVIVSNSGSNTIAFYKFDSINNKIASREPEYTLGKRQSSLAFPHGLAVSPDGCYLVVTQFGPLKTTKDEDIIFDRKTPTRQSKILIFERRLCDKSTISQKGRAWTPWIRQLRDRIEGRS